MDNLLESPDKLATVGFFVHDSDPVHLWDVMSSDLKGGESGNCADFDLETGLDIIPQAAYPSPDYDMESFPVPLLDEESAEFLENQSVSLADLVSSFDDNDNVLTDMASSESAALQASEPQFEPVVRSEPADDPVDVHAALREVVENLNQGQKQPETFIINLEGLSDSECSTEGGDVKKSYNLRTRSERDSSKSDPHPGKVDTSPSPAVSVRRMSIRQRNAGVKHTPVSDGLDAYLKNKQNKKDVGVMPDVDLGDLAINKSAIQARINRQKKKAYIEGLEEEVAGLSKANKKLTLQVQTLQKDKRLLKEEVRYLKSVLANQSTLSALLKNIENVDGVQLSSSFEVTRKRSADDHDYGKPAKSGRYFDVAPSGGVCLHVSNSSKVSMEFCAKCSGMAAGGPRDDGVKMSSGEDE